MTLGCYLTQQAPTPPDMQLGLLPCPTNENETCTTYFNTSIVAVAATIVAVVQACETVRVQMICGRCTLIDQRHRMALELGVSSLTQKT